MERAYYKEYYELERSHWWFLARAEIIKEQVKVLAKNKKNLNILNIGTATGKGSEMLFEFGQVTSLEYDADCIKFLRNELKMEVVEGSILELPFDNESYDLVCAFDVVEHVIEDQLAVNEMKRVCKVGGYIFCTVPCYNFLWSKHDDINHHYRRYTSSSFRKLFASLEITFSTYFNALLFIPISTFRIISKIAPTRKMRQGTGSDFSLKCSSLINNTLLNIFKLENSLIKRKIRLPFGVSFLLLARKIR